MKAVLVDPSSWIMWVLGGLVAGISWVIRRIFTNQKEIEVIKENLKHLHETAIKESKEFRAALIRETDARIEETKELRKLQTEIVRSIGLLANTVKKD